jgi:metal-responsive CopG/Arc/MetJ family transcriptional regulator
MPRRPVKEARQQYSVMLKPSTVKELDRISEKYGLTRSQFMGNLIEMALDDAKLFENIGLFKMVILGDKVMKKFKEAVAKGKVSFDEEGELEIRK